MTQKSVIHHVVHDTKVCYTLGSVFLVYEYHTLGFTVPKRAYK